MLHWKNYARTHAALTSLGQISYPNFRVIIVDNFSEDGSLDRLEREFPSHIFVHNQANLGFGRGCNAGMRVAHANGGAYVLLLNNDMEVARNFLEPAVEAAEKMESVGLVTGKILFGDRRNIVWQAGGSIDRLRIQGRPRGWNEPDQGQYDDQCETHWASGAMLLIPRRTIDVVGMLPEEYFFGVEEWDYSTTVRMVGLRILYVPEFEGYHHAGGSYKPGDPTLIVYNGIRNKLIYAQKHLSRPAWLAWRLIFRCYLSLLWPRKARWGCQTEDDYRARLNAARMAFADHCGVNRVELADLQRAALRIGPTTTWGSAWGPTNQ